MTPETFQLQVLIWFDQFGRKNLPWQDPVSAYRVWLSEVMLQQTQVMTVIPYFKKFIKQYPSVKAIANAPLDDVLSLWAGLGYYARARNLHKAAKYIDEFGFPETLETLTDLPGVGRSTAGAILSIAFNKSHAILDGNVRRVLARFKGVEGWIGRSVVNKQLWKISEHYTPQTRVADYTQAMMDLGATVCTRSKPLCTQCPLQSNCQALIQNKIHLLPTPKASKKIPVKQLTLAIIFNENDEIFLEKRPPVGIWGGLWSIPEFENKADILKWIDKSQLIVHKMRELPIRRHTFSHYHLDYLPVQLSVDSPINNVMEAGLKIWYKHTQHNNIALPAPIKQLFDDLKEE
jgi:A/G-specific adenine glycosylase